MKARLLLCALLALTLIAVLHGLRAQTPSSDSYLTAHEWGTFTSIAGKTGEPVEWMPLNGSTDLPGFVEHFSGVNFKAGLLGTVRMETPVLYFYTTRETTVSVNVSFSKGLITEWYPHADRVYPISAIAPQYAKFSDWSLSQNHPDGTIAWDSVQLQPRNFAEMPTNQSENHYYAARRTASTPVQVKTSNGMQTEKFLFYRGVSTFAVPVSVKINPDGDVLAENAADTRIPAALLFERRGDKFGFRASQAPGRNLTFKSPKLNGDMNSLKQTVVELLVSQGLYDDEAQAMFETWRDSWFEEGSRLLYIVPRSFVDSILPLTIQPAPSQTVRVFVGRIELVTPATRRAIEQAVAAHDDVTLSLYSRFLTPILKTTIAFETDPARRAQLSCYMGDNTACKSLTSQNGLR